MNHIVSVTLIPVVGRNVVLDKELFLDNFVDKAEDVLDRLPVGCAIEIVYDHIITDSNGNFQKSKHCRCIVKQNGRGNFVKTITTAPIESSITAWRYHALLKKKFSK